MSTISQTIVKPPVADAADPSSTLSDCLTIKQVAAAYRVQRLTVRRWASEGIIGLDGVRRTLPSFKLGRARYVRKADLNQFLEAQNVPR